MNQRPAYVARINAVIDHIGSHLGEPLDLAALAAVAHFSPWHFHRMFQAFTVRSHAERLAARRFSRLGGAAAQRRIELSKIHQAQRKPDQALAAHFRDDPRTGPISGLDPFPEVNAMNVKLENFPERRLAYMRYIGPYGDPGIHALWQRFGAWTHQHGLADGGHASFGIAHDSPDITDARNCRYDACIEVDASFRAEGEVGIQLISGGLYACTPFRDTPDKIHAAWLRLFSDWLPDSAYQADDRPSLDTYGCTIEGDEETGAFACGLCLPVRAAA